MANYITIAADDVTKLRRCDVFRVLEWCPADQRTKLGEWIGEQRPELWQEVVDCLADLN